MKLNASAEEETKENAPADGEPKVQKLEEETKEAVSLEGEVKEKTADEAQIPSEESGENWKQGWLTWWALVIKINSFLHKFT